MMRSRHSSHGRVGPRATRIVVGMLMAAMLAAGGRRASAQELTTALGLAGGLVAGTWMTTGLHVFRSRATGSFLHSPSELIAVRPEVLPMVVTPIAGAVLGYRSPGKLSAAAAWGGLGLVSGGVIGIGVGHLIWGDSGGRWAGGTIGSALGLAVGAIVGAVSRTANDDDGGGPSAPYLTFSMPLGARR